MLTPGYKLSIGGKLIDTTDEPRASTLVSLVVTLDIDAPVDTVSLVLGEVGTLAPAKGDRVEVDLGYTDDGDLSRVLTGALAHVEHSPSTTRVVGNGGTSSLLRTKVDETFQGKSAGAIVRDLAGRAGVDVAVAEDVTTFPAYVVDGRRSVYRHMHDLGRLCGTDLYLDAEGRLVFERYAGGKTVHVLEYAKHLLEVEVELGPQSADVVEAWGEGPGGGKGEDAWAWLTKDFSGSKGSAGSGSNKLLLERPALRTAEAARLAADAAQTAARRRAVRGRVLIAGRAQVKLGDAVRLRGVPEDGANGVFQVRSVTHRITKVGGFTTAITFRGAG